MTRSLRGTRVVLCATVLTVAGCNSNPVGPDEPFGSAAGTNAEQRVGSSGGGGNVCPGDEAEGETCAVGVTLSLITAGGDQISGACEMAFNPTETKFETNDLGCPFSGTGRFEELSTHLWEIDLSSPSTAQMFFQVTLPKFGGQTFETRNHLDAARTVEATDTCNQAVRVRFSGTMEHFGRVTGEISYCSPSA